MASASVVQSNHEKINAALETEISPKDFQSMIASMKNLEETLVTLNPKTMKRVIARISDPDELLCKLDSELLEEIFSQMPSVHAKRLKRSWQKLADCWFKDLEDVDYEFLKEENEYPFESEPEDDPQDNVHPHPVIYFYCVEQYGGPCAPMWYGAEQFDPIQYGDLHFQQFKGQGNPLVDYLSPSVRHTILKYMPNIPDDLADSLFFLDSGFVSYIINRHEILPSFMTDMHPMTIKHIMSCVNELPSLVANMEPSTIEKIFSGVENICDYLVSKLQDATSIKTIVKKVPNFHHCVPQLVLE